MRPQAFSEMTCFSALAWRRLGHPDRAARLIDGLAAHLAELRGTPARIDYFTTSLPTMLLFDDDLQARQDTQAEFLAAQLAALRGQRDTALDHLAVVLAREPAHLPARALRAELAALPS
jgi:thioredoxin-like negative regulator of GroEL